MSGYDIDRFLSDFTARTKKNLEYICAVKKNNADNEDELYEVTQLINSILGLVVIPSETFKNDRICNDMLLMKMACQEYNMIKDIIKICRSESRYFNNYENNVDNEVTLFINHIRNSVAHGGHWGLHFYPLLNETEPITDIIFYDTDYNPNNTNRAFSEFCIKLSIDEIKKWPTAFLYY